MLFAPLVGYVADRHHRPRLLAACLLVWSGATLASGLVTTAAGLYTARFLIGVGEAGCLVVGPSLLADAFPASARGRVLSLFYLGMPLGGAAGYIVGGVVSQHFGGFRAAFWVAGAPGLVLAVAVARLADPPRTAPSGGNPATAHRHRGLRPYLGLLRNRALLLVVLAQTFAVGVLAPILHFAVRFFEVERAMTRVQATATLAGIALVAGLLGSSLSGVLGDRMNRARPGGHARLAAIGYGLAMPAILVGFTAPSPWVFGPALFVGSTCLFLCMPAVNTEIANVVPSTQRAMAYALAVFVLHLLGDMAAPPVFGAVAGRIGTGAAFARASGLLLLASACAYLASRRTSRRAAAHVPP